MGILNLGALRGLSLGALVAVVGCGQSSSTPVGQGPGGQSQEVSPSQKKAPSQMSGQGGEGAGSGSSAGLLDVEDQEETPQKARTPARLELLVSTMSHGLADAVIEQGEGADISCRYLAARTASESELIGVLVQSKSRGTLFEMTLSGPATWLGTGSYFYGAQMGLKVQAPLEDGEPLVEYQIGTDFSGASTVCEVHMMQRDESLRADINCRHMRPTPESSEYLSVSGVGASLLAAIDCPSETSIGEQPLSAPLALSATDASLPAYCQGTPAACSQFDEDACSQMSGCFMSGACLGFNECNRIGTRDGCLAQPGCTYSESCAGTAESCSSTLDESSCEAREFCSWHVKYPSY